MAKYQIIAVLLTPNGNYTETECPKGYADYMALDKAYETDDFDSMESIVLETEFCSAETNNPSDFNCLIYFSRTSESCFIFLSFLVIE